MYDAAVKDLLEHSLWRIILQLGTCCGARENSFDHASVPMYGAPLKRINFSPGKNLEWTNSPTVVSASLMSKENACPLAVNSLPKRSWFITCDCAPIGANPSIEPPKATGIVAAAANHNRKRMVNACQLRQRWIMLPCSTARAIKLEVAFGRACTFWA